MDLAELRKQLSLDYGVWLRIPDEYIMRPFNLQQESNMETIGQTHQELELLGDSLLDVMVYDYLSKQNTKNIQSIRAQTVSNDYLGKIVENKDLSKYVIRSGYFREYKALANVFEALLGSLYLGLRSIGRNDRFQILEEWVFGYWDIQNRLDEYVQLYRA